MEIRRIALIGNPNTGKSSLFNHLTGLRQHVGNFPGVTVDKKTGTATLFPGRTVEVVDLPGTYSVFPRSADEEVVYSIVSNSAHPDFPDLFVVIADAVNLERNLLLFTQLYDLGLPLVLVLTMEDIITRKNKKIDLAKISERFGEVPVAFINARDGKGITELKRMIANYRKPGVFDPACSGDLRSLRSDEMAQVKNTEERFATIRERLQGVMSTTAPVQHVNKTRKLDKLLVHPFWGYGIFLFTLFVIFQFVYRFASIPMDLIDESFLHLSKFFAEALPEGVISDLISQGVVPGIGGVVVFIPQIALLFFFLALLEETGYMSRVVFLMDRLVKPFGLNGKSVVPLMSSVACAIPGIMATRTISNWKDRLITILVAPLMSCSARIPVYTLLIALVIPDEPVWGILDLRGLVLLGLYGLGLFSALAVALVMKLLIHTEEPGYLIMEMPSYKFPRWGHVAIHLWEKVRVFVFDAGKIILSISVLLWALASYGPGDRMEEAMIAAQQDISIPEEEKEAAVNSARLENSWIGIMGRGIEPVISPLGYDWKIGIALITSFAAREVFVGSMATIYSVGEDFEENKALMDRLRAEKHPETGEPVYTLASGISLMIFYAFAMQCMSTFAVVKRETRSWKWPLIQLTYMGLLAWLASFAVYQMLIP